MMVSSRNLLFQGLFSGAMLVYVRFREGILFQMAGSTSTTRYLFGEI